MNKDNLRDAMAIEAKESDIAKDKLILKDVDGNRVGKVDLKNKKVEVNEDNLEKASRNAGHSEKAMRKMVETCGEIAAKNSNKFKEDDGTPDFRLHEKANKAATIIARPDNSEKDIDTGVEIKFSDLTARLNKINKQYK